MSHKAERRPGSGKIWFAVTKHDGVQVDSILIDQATFGEAVRQAGPATSISPPPPAFSSRIAASRSSSTSLAMGPTDFNERETTHFRWSATPTQRRVPLHPIRDDRRPNNE